MLYKCPSWLSSHLLQNEISICNDGQYNQIVSWQAFAMSQHKAELKQCTQKMQWLGCELGNSILLWRVVSLSQTNPYPGHWSSLSRTWHTAAPIQGEHCRLPAANAPSNWHYNCPPCTMRRAHTPTAAARLGPGSVQPETHSVVQSRRTPLSPGACTKQGQ